MEIISDCLHLKVNLKIIYMLTLLPKGVQTKNLKLSDLRFFPFATGFNDTGGAHLELRISL
jgi:hypothetical protein